MSDAQKWTPGERVVKQYGGAAPKVWTRDGAKIATFHNTDDPDRALADALLDAAAPKMYDALLVVEDHIEDCAATTHGTPCKDKAPCGPCAAKRLVRAACAEAAREEQKP